MTGAKHFLFSEFQSFVLANGLQFLRFKVGIIFKTLTNFTTLKALHLPIYLLKIKKKTLEKLLG